MNKEFFELRLQDIEKKISAKTQYIQQLDQMIKQENANFNVLLGNKYELQSIIVEYNKAQLSALDEQECA